MSSDTRHAPERCKAAWCTAHPGINQTMIDLIAFTAPPQAEAKEQCRRLFHGRGQAYAGLAHVNIDWWPPVVLITLYEEVDRRWLQQLAADIKDKLAECRAVMVQYRCRPRAPFEQLLGDDTFEALVADENGLKFHIQLGRSQNIGLFLDMCEGRQWVRDHSRGKRVLNLFAYTCGFSVAAIAGGARHVVNVDISRASLTRGRENHRLNGHDLRGVTFQSIDIFKSFSRLKKLGPYDLLICDPPGFQKGSVDIRRDYRKILRRIPALLNPGGQFLLCLNVPALDDAFLHQQVAEHCPSARFVQAIDTPDVFKEAIQGKGLKVLLYDYPGESR